MIKPITKTITYFDWNELVEEVQKSTNRDIRNWKGTKFNGLPDDPPYCDFWHQLIDAYSGQIHNPCTISVNFVELAEYFKEFSDSGWIVEICNEFAKVLGPGDHDIYIEW